MSTESEKPEKGYSAFISHASADHEAAETIAASLEAKGLSCWIAPRDVRPGAEYAEEILRGIERSKCFVLVLSEAANLSGHVRREVERAASKGKTIYPVRIEDVPPSPKLEYFVSMHHWLDAWEGVLSEHADRLASALESQEEWVSNLVVKRRRRRTIGLGAGLTLAVIAILVGLVFSTDLRRLFMSDQQRAVEALKEKGIPVGIEGLGRALKAASVEDLALLEKAGITTQQLNAAFTDNAGDFFEKSRDMPEAIAWLKHALDNGLDPNLLLPNSHYGQEAALASALRAGNADAVIALLEAGASPHVYQDLWLSPYDIPRFLFPYTYVIKSDRLTREEKGRVAAAYQKAGAVFMTLASEWSGGGETYQTQAIEEVREGAVDQFGFALKETPSACNGRKATPICKAASARTGTDWCAFMANLPVRILWNANKSYDLNLLRIDLQYLLTVVGDKAYVLATETIGREREYLLVEIASDQTHWNVYKYTHPVAGMGLCKKYVTDTGANSVAPEDCWRRWSMTYRPDQKLMKIEDYYDYEVLFSCDKERPQAK